MLHQPLSSFLGDFRPPEDQRRVDEIRRMERCLASSPIALEALDFAGGWLQGLCQPSIGGCIQLTEGGRDLKWPPARHNLSLAVVDVFSHVLPVRPLR